jgi:putative sigma-54 modulation protein
MAAPLAELPGLQTIRLSALTTLVDPQPVGESRMQIDFHFRNLESSEAMKAYAVDKLAKLEKYVREPAEVHVTFGLERHIHGIDVALTAAGERYQGRAEHEDMYASIDLVLDKLLRQLHRARGQHRNQSPEHWFSRAAT